MAMSRRKGTGVNATAAKKSRGGRTDGRANGREEATEA
jgi:hypothetical protein